MSGDLDDTVITPPRAPQAATGTEAQDSDDTVIALPAIADPLPAPSEPPTVPLATRVYSFRVGERSDAIALDVPCYVGRRPSSPRIVSGMHPRLVRVPSPLREVSATHLEVRQLGSSVIVTDLKSTNGSIVMQPGSVPRKLRQGESVVVSPGTLVDIGDENILQILPMQRLA